VADDVEVDLARLREYALDMMTKGGEPAMKVATATANMAPLIQQAFTTPTDAGYFAEGAVVSGVLAQHMSDFTHFAQDVSKGMQYMGGALGVIALTYQNSDVNAAEDMNLVNFAFGWGGEKPDGYTGDDKTFSELRAEEMSRTGENSMAAVGNPALADYSVSQYPVSYLHFPDGSAIMTTTAYYDEGGVTGTVVTTTVTNSAGQVISTSRAVTGRNSSGYPTTIKSQQGTPDGPTTTTTTTNQGETIQVDTTTSGPGIETQHDTTTVYVGEHADDQEEQGPVEQAQERFDTPGYQDVVEERGLGY
jgi:hypothetical protein